MGYLSSVKAHWSFNNNIEDSALNNDFVSSGPIVLFGRYSVYNMVSNQTETKYGVLLDNYYTANSVNLLNLGNTAHDFTISFWWYSPSVVGYTRHAITRKETSKVTPIVGKGRVVEDESFKFVDDGEFIISEVSASSSCNAIKLEICTTNSSPTHEYLSKSYIPGLHHVMISYKSTIDPISEIKIIIDGEQGETQFGPEYNMSTTLSNIYVNRLYHGYLAHESRQVGSFISDLVIKTSNADNAERDAIRNIRFGTNYIVDKSLEHVEHEFFGLGYSQPSTITTKQIYASGGNIYVARSNGDILKGYRPIWDTESNYATDGSNLTSNPKITVTSNGLRIAGTTIRI
jgi:hypothetical protein